MALRERRTSCIKVTYLSFRALLLLLEFTALILVAKGIACFVEMARNGAGYMTQLCVGIIVELGSIALIVRQKPDQKPDQEPDQKYDQIPDEKPDQKPDRKPDQSLWMQMRFVAYADTLLWLLCALGFVMDAVIDPRTDPSMPLSFYLDEYPEKNRCRNRWLQPGALIALVCGCLHFVFMAASSVECCIRRFRYKK